MDQINEWLKHVGNNYLLIAVAAIIFFTAKTITGYLTYRKFDKRLKRMEGKIEQLLKK